MIVVITEWNAIHLEILDAKWNAIHLEILDDLDELPPNDWIVSYGNQVNLVVERVNTRA